MDLFAIDYKGGILGLIIGAGPVVKLVLCILLLFSIISWAIILFKFKMLHQAAKESKIFWRLFKGGEKLSEIYTHSKGLKASPLVHIFRTGYLELARVNPKESTRWIDNITRGLNKATISEIDRLEGTLGFLATTGNTTPFIGLFGTVWGIMDAFRQIGLRGSTSLTTVAPGISEALIATAAGLGCAIPAVIFYNHYLHKIKILTSEMDNFSAEFLNLLERKKDDL